MKFHKTIHRILLMIGVALGIITTGATANAKTQQININSTQNNNPSDQNINRNQFSSSSSRLVNRLESSHIVNRVNSESIDTSSSSGANFGSTSYNHANLNSGKTSSSASESNLRSQQGNRFNGRNSNILSSKRLFHTKLNHVYRNIISNSGSKIHQSSKGNTNVNLNCSAHVAHHQQINSWFRDGLNSQNLKARNWVSWHESSHRWRVLSYGGVCVGYFQLNPRYLGYRNGHVDLRPEHQVQVADKYVQKRYGSWVNAKQFWISHHWY